VTKEQIIREIRRTAEANGGVPVGRKRFLDETGIRESDWAGRYWTRWSDAIREAGFTPQAMNPALPDEVILTATAQITRRLGHFPTAVEIRLACQSDPDLPSHNTFRRFGGLGTLRARLATFSRERGLDDVLAILPEAGVPPIGEAETTGESSDSVDGFVYLLKSGSHYKIGKAMSVEARKRQLAIQLPKPAEELHRIKTDDPLGIEAYWHRRFADKRLNGEWFSLSAEDVKTFRRRKFM
jgi:hypothetical protein